MSVNSEVKAAFSKVAPIEADTYEGKEEVYITFSFNSVPADFGDDEPGHEILLLSVHLFAPTGKNVLKKRGAIKKAFFKLTGSWPSETNASDKEGQHLVYEGELAREVE